WAPDWTAPEREETWRRAKEALSPQETLEGAIAYYRDLPLGGAPAVERVGAVPGLIIGGDHALVQEGLYGATAALLPGPSRPLIGEGAGHWPRREKAAGVIPEMLRFLSELPA